MLLLILKEQFFQKIVYNELMNNYDKKTMQVLLFSNVTPRLKEKQNWSIINGYITNFSFTTLPIWYFSSCRVDRPIDGVVNIILLDGK